MKKFKVSREKSIIVNDDKDINNQNMYEPHSVFTRYGCDVWGLILAHLPYNDVIDISKVCTYFKSIARLVTTWRIFFQIRDLDSAELLPLTTTTFRDCIIYWRKNMTLRMFKNLFEERYIFLPHGVVFDNVKQNYKNIIEKYQRHNTIEPIKKLKEKLMQLKLVSIDLVKNKINIKAGEQTLDAQEYIEWRATLIEKYTNMIDYDKKADLKEGVILATIITEGGVSATIHIKTMKYLGYKPKYALPNYKNLIINKICQDSEIHCICATRIIGCVKCTNHVKKNLLHVFQMTIFLSSVLDLFQ